jgi:hypothetical protein
VADFSDLLRVADGHTTILTPQFPLTGTDPMARAFAQIAAVFAELELGRAKERAHRGRAARQARGDDFGHATWGRRHVRNDRGQIVEVADPDKADEVARVIATVREAGTILGGVRLLNERRIPSPRQGTWHPSALTRVVKAHAPELLGQAKPRGKEPRPAYLAKLLRCHCGQTLTANAARGQYYCYAGHRKGAEAHGKMSTTEDGILPWVLQHFKEYEQHSELTVRIATAERRLEELTGQRERLGFALVDGLLTREQGRERAAAIDAEISDLSRDLTAMRAATVRAPVAYIPAGDPDGIEAMNRQLRAAIRWIQMDEQMQPVAVEWVGA